MSRKTRTNELPAAAASLPAWDWHALAHEVVAGRPCPREAALAILKSPDTELLGILDAAFTIRRRFYGRKVKLNMLINAKSGLCPEDCGYCSQSSRSNAEVNKYPLVAREVLVEGARRAAELKAGTYCIVCSGRGPTDKEVEEIAAAVREIRARFPLKICACLGLLREEQARKLFEAGVQRYNHNLNTSAGHFRAITTTHDYEDRVETIQHVKEAGISACAGGIIGMGESHDDVLEMAYALRTLDVDSIPVNFLHPVEGTPLQGMDRKHPLTPTYCLKVLAMLRFVCPSKEIRVAGGRELNLRSLQPLALYAANSIFVGDYLTTAGQAPTLDIQMIQDLGFEIEEVCPDSVAHWRAGGLEKK